VSHPALKTQPLPLVDLRRQHEQLKTEIDAAIARVFASSQFVLGPEVKAFEDEFAAYCGTAAAVACANGTDALELALWGAGVRPGDEVITVANTFAATAEAIIRCGAAPRFVDVSPDTLLMDLDQVEAAITDRTVAVVPVHLFGSCVDMEALMAIAHRRGVKVIEDAAQAHGAVTNGRRAGSIGDAGCFSFYPGKNLGAAGDAGAVITSNLELAARLRQARDHGRVGKYEHAIVGRNSRMDAIQAALLRVKLPHLEEWNQRRRTLAGRYRSLLAEIPGVTVVRTPEPPASVHHLFVIESDRRDELCQGLADAGILTGIHYPIPLHLQSAFAGLAEAGSLPVTEAAAQRIVSLPLFPEMREAEVDLVVRAIRSHPVR
jgi:dTDP-4-amino-4,6-dideoxygalactose transaminase